MNLIVNPNLTFTAVDHVVWRSKFFNNILLGRDADNQFTLNQTIRYPPPLQSIITNAVVFVIL